MTGAPAKQGSPAPRRRRNAILAGPPGDPLRERLRSRRRRLAAAIAVSPRGDLVRLLAAVDAALARIAAGPPVCAVCHEPIEAGRLRDDPLARVCLDCLTPAERAALENDLALAAAVQAHLLPRRRLNLGGWDIAYDYQPLGPVSGDHCDLVAPAGPGGPALFLCGDVAGKGLAAALVMAHLQALLRALAALDLELPELLARANRLLCGATQASSFATLVAGRLGARGEVEIANAGHPAALLVRAGTVESVPAGGLPLGLFADGRYAARRLALAPGELLVLYTDGLTEARNPAGEEYGAARLQTLVGRAPRDPAAAVAACLADLARFQAGAPRGDDLTVMAIRRAA